MNQNDFKKKVEVKGISVREVQVWSCKIGIVDAKKLYSVSGADGPMRDAVTAAFMLLFGEAPMFLFSGWNSELTDSEIRCVLDK